MGQDQTFEAHLRATVGSLHTVEAYLRDAAAFEKFLERRSPTIQLVEEWIARLRKNRKPQTVGRHLSAMRRWLAWKARHGDKAALETATLLKTGYKISPPTRQRDRKIVRPLSEEDFQAVLTALSPNLRALLEFLWGTGARVSEALGDPKADIPALTVADGLLLWREGYTRTTGKGGRVRTLFWPRKSRSEFIEFVLKAIPLQSSKLASVLRAPLFRSTSGQALSKQSLNRSLHLGAAKAKVKPFGVHAIRHAFRARLRKAGVSEEIMRVVMGHSARGVTETYGRADIQEILMELEK